MDFLVVFLVCLAVLLLLTVTLLFGRQPSYRPSRHQALEMASLLCEGRLPPEKWSLFIGIPVVHDPELELIRRDCYELEVAAEHGDGCRMGAGRLRYDEAGMLRLQCLRKRLEQLVQSTPVSRWF